MTRTHSQWNDPEWKGRGEESRHTFVQMWVSFGCGVHGCSAEAIKAIRALCHGGCAHFLTDAVYSHPLPSESGVPHVNHVRCYPLGPLCPTVFHSVRMCMQVSGRLHMRPPNAAAINWPAMGMCLESRVILKAIIMLLATTSPTIHSPVASARLLNRRRRARDVSGTNQSIAWLAFCTPMVIGFTPAHLRVLMAEMLTMNKPTKEWLGSLPHVVSRGEDGQLFFAHVVPPCASYVPLAYIACHEAQSAPPLQEVNPLAGLCPEVSAPDTSNF